MRFGEHRNKINFSVFSSQKKKSHHTLFQNNYKPYFNIIRYLGQASPYPYKREMVKQKINIKANYSNYQNKQDNNEIQINKLEIYLFNKIKIIGYYSSIKINIEFQSCFKSNKDDQKHQGLSKIFVRIISFFQYQTEKITMIMSKQDQIEK
ncbi:unnamed protein product [Paramecium primaurelia]|uniref:Uncharacterized protein n=1 Tax=Paramecium primaurelia TaxID=5886 RepID=A0A8S1JLM4_PARPR|nr:unnamed protein product [Paramecium primaurelia]